MSVSRNLLFFAIAVGLFALLQMLLSNQDTLLWSGPESLMAWIAVGGDQAVQWSEHYFSWLWQAAQGDLLAYRLPSAGVLTLGALGFSLLAKPLFGMRSAILSAAIALSTLSLPFLGKMATMDSPLLVFHGLALLTILRFAKQPQLIWGVLSYLLIVLSALINPWSTFIFFTFGIGVMWYHRHRYPGLRKLQPWWAAMAVLAIAWVGGTKTLGLPWFYLQRDYFAFLAFIFLGFLPFTGFLVAGFRDYFGKMRKGDEMSVIILSWLLAALIGASPAAFWMLALMVARQMDAFFQAGYPYRNWIKTGAVLHLVLAFFVAMAIIMYGIYEFQSPGFRAGVAASGIYWSMSFMGIIGIFGARRNFTIGGPILAGALTMLVAWTMAFPLLEQQRKEKLGLLDSLDSRASSAQVLYSYPGEFPHLAVYGRWRHPELKWSVVKNSLPADNPEGFLLVEKNIRNVPDFCKDTIQYGQDFSLLFCPPGTRNQ